MTPLRTAVIVEVREAASVVDAWRERTSYAKPSAGVPAHLTILFPFLPAAELDRAVDERLRAVALAFEPFRYELVEARRFPGVLYLAPEPPEPFLALTDALVSAFPAYPPYEGAFDEVIPHVTAAEGRHDVLDRAEEEIVGSLPLSCRAAELLLLEEVEPDSARWRAHARFPLGA